MHSSSSPALLQVSLALEAYGRESPPPLCICAQPLDVIALRFNPFVPRCFQDLAWIGDTGIVLALGKQRGDSPIQTEEVRMVLHDVAMRSYTHLPGAEGLSRFTPAWCRLAA
jgi:hypothetical protein